MCGLTCSTSPVRGCRCAQSLLRLVHNGHMQLLDLSDAICLIVYKICACDFCAGHASCVVCTRMAMCLIVSIPLPTMFGCITTRLNTVFPEFFDVSRSKEEIRGHDLFEHLHHVTSLALATKKLWVPKKSCSIDAHCYLP